MSVGQQRMPLVRRELLETTSASEEVGSGVAGIVQHLQSTAMDDFAPDDFALANTASQLAGKLPALLAKVLHGGHRRARFFKGLEELAERALHLPIRFQHHAIFRVIDETNRKRRSEFSATRLALDASSQ